MADVELQSEEAGESSGLKRHWDDWIKSLGPLLLVAVGVGLYRFDILPEQYAGAALVLVIVLGTLLSTAWPAWSFVRTPLQKGLFFTMALLWLASSLYEPLRLAFPSKPLAETNLTPNALTQKVTVDRDGPFEATVSGAFKAPGASEVEATYTLKVESGSTSDSVTGEIKRNIQRNRVSRRGGTSTTLTQHTEESFRLPTVSGRELTISTDGIDEQLDDSLHVAIRHGGPPPLIFLVFGVLMVLFALALDTKLVDFKGKLAKTYVTCGAAVALVFAQRFTHVATPSASVRPGIDSLILGLLAGGLGGWVLSSIARFMFGPKPPKAIATR
jgi:hypothetical protein